MEHAHPLAWSDSFAVGHDVLDSQHRSMIDAINAVAAAVREHPQRLADATNALREQLLEHIRSENALLWEIKSGIYEPLHGRLQAPDVLKAMAAAAFDQHMAMHEEFLARFEDIIAGSPDRLYESLKTWFVDHAIKHDLPLKAIFQAV
jgi:hemerythrin